MQSGREAMFHELMERFSEIQNRYKGVRGELLAKVRAELETLQPGAKASSPAPAPKATPAANPQPAAAPAPRVATGSMLPSCRSCGGTMREAGDGSLVCARGHVRQLAS